MSLGTYVMYHTTLDKESNVLLSFDFSKRPEIVGGATISSAVMRIQQNDVASSALTLGAPVIDPTGKIAQVRVTDVSGVPGAVYSLICDPTFSDGTTLVRSITIQMTGAGA